MRSMSLLKKFNSRNFVVGFLTTLLLGCVSIPAGIQPVTGFDAERYLGTWYEIARLDHRFERGLYNVTATYTQKSDGSIKVENRGYVRKSSEWKSAIGKAKFVSDAETGHLKVSFFGPFYGSYVVFELDENYQYAFVSGNNRKSLWFLSRQRDPAPELLEKFRASAESLGFDLATLIDDVQDPELPGE